MISINCIDYRMNPMSDNLSAKHPDRTPNQIDNTRLSTQINPTKRSNLTDAALVIPRRSTYRDSSQETRDNMS